MDKILDVSELLNDDENFNLGTEEGMELLNKSISELGFGRSILIDKNNKVIAGNKSLDISRLSGLKRVRVIETEGNQLVAVKRTDVDLDTKKGRELAIADNSISIANLKWDKESLSKVSDEFGIDREEWGVRKDVEWVDGVGAESSVPSVVCPSCFLEFSVIKDEENN